MLISCLLPTFNRYPANGWLVEEAVESFLRQDYPNKELIICNDTPGQVLIFNHPQVRVINTADRFPTLGAKIHWMLERAEGNYVCRWDDDDISLPWRLSLSRDHICHNKHSDTEFAMEWRPESHWYDPKHGSLSITTHPGNTHIMSIWHKDIILKGGVQYPGKPCPSGCEDQTFNRFLWDQGYPRFGDTLPPDKIFYLYRWGVCSTHLSGKGGGQTMQATYTDLARHVSEGTFEIRPQWHSDHIARTVAATRKLHPQASN